MGPRADEKVAENPGPRADKKYKERRLKSVGPPVTLFKR